MISCRRAAELTSLQLDSDLGLGQKFALRFHRVMCRACRVFGRQMIEVDQATGEFLQEWPTEAEPMPEDSRIRIQNHLDAARPNER